MLGNSIDRYRAEGRAVGLVDSSLVLNRHDERYPPRPRRRDRWYSPCDERRAEISGETSIISPRPDKPSNERIGIITLLLIIEYIIYV